MCLKNIIDLFKKNTKKEINLKETNINLQVNSQNLKILELIKSLDFSNELSWTWIVLHHSWSWDNLKINNWNSIDTYHRSWRYLGNIISEKEAKELINDGVKEVQEPWPTIAYHFGIEFENNELVYKRGCPLSKIGYHTKGFNKKALGICFVGDFDENILTQQHYEIGVNLINFLIQRYKIPIEHVIGHRESYSLLKKPCEKSCPGLKFDLDKFRSLLNKI